MIILGIIFGSRLFIDICICQRSTIKVKEKEINSYIDCVLPKVPTVRLA